MSTQYTPAQNYQPPPQVIIQTTATLVPLGSTPSRVQCPSCHSEVLTTVKRTATTRTHLWALGLCIFLCWPCVCVPYCMDSCMNAEHSCPNCGSYIGTYEN